MRSTVRGGGSGGFSLVEASVAAAILGIVLLAVAGMLQESLRATNHMSVQVELETQARKILNDITRELVDSGMHRSTDFMTSHTRAAGATGTTTITFQRRIGLTTREATSTLDWSTAITFALAASPGENATNTVDDDGDHITDEQRIVRTQNSASRTIADNVTALSFTRFAGGASTDVHPPVTISLTLSNWDPDQKKVATRTVTTQVAVRNVDKE